MEWRKGSGRERIKNERFLSFQVENKTGRVKFDVSASSSKTKQKRNHKHTYTDLLEKFQG